MIRIVETGEEERSSGFSFDYIVEDEDWLVNKVLKEGTKADRAPGITMYSHWIHEGFIMVY
jgi:hypothetical protein